MKYFENGGKAYHLKDLNVSKYNTGETEIFYWYETLLVGKFNLKVGDVVNTAGPKITGKKGMVVVKMNYLELRM